MEMGFYLVKIVIGKVICIVDLVDDDLSKCNWVVVVLCLFEVKKNWDYVDIIIVLGMAKEGFDWVWCEYVLMIGYCFSFIEIV